jgi:predicted ATPase/class 3 adenylate cyclase
MLVEVGLVEPDGGAVEPAIFTFLFTDVVGSTRRWQEDPGGMPVDLAAHDRCLTAAVEAHGGRVFKHTGDGICAVFGSAPYALLAAIQGQRELKLPARMAIHTGEAIRREDDFFGLALSRCARLLEVAYGGQVLVSAGAATQMEPLAREVQLWDLGEHRLRDLAQAERIFEVRAAGLKAEFPALRSLDSVRHNLPILRSTFIGRENELVEVSGRLESGRLVTLTGSGGCGKTRLALEVAAFQSRSFPQGVFFVDLAVVSDPALVSSAVAKALDLLLIDADVDNLRRCLAARRALIVLDNCEHLLDACADLVDGLLGYCSEIHVLATSREALGVDGEQVFRVPSLSVEAEAVRLFLDRARAVGARLESDAATDRAVLDICRRLDGIPLAIELAAARTTHLTPGQILERLSDRFRLLTGGRRKVPRQQTLAAAIDWSHDLLNEDEQSLLRRLAVFRGTFSLEAAEQICHPRALDLLRSLINKSLVDVSAGGTTPRYRLSETVRLYAAERLLVAGEAERFRSAHRDWLLQWLRSIPFDDLLAGGGAHQIVPEADNLLAALEWSREQGRLDLIAEMAARMIGYWWRFFRVGELTAWWEVLREALPQLREPHQPAALIVGAHQGLVTADFDLMEKLSAEVIGRAMADETQPDASSSAAFNRGIVAFAWWLQSVYWMSLEPQKGLRCIAEGRRVARSAGLPEMERATAMQALALITGDPEHDEEIGAAGMLEAMLAMVEVDGSSRVTWDDSSQLTWELLIGVLAALGETETASRLASSVPVKTTSANFFHRLIMLIIAIREKRIDDAEGHLYRLVEQVREYAMPLGEESCLTCFAALAVERGDHQTASRHLACVKASVNAGLRTPVESLIYRQTARAVRDALDPATARRCREEGMLVKVSEALDTEMARLPTYSPPGPT